MIEVAHLAKTYRVHRRAAGLAAALRSLWRRPTAPVLAVDDLSFVIGAGERVGFLGPNGAGKTTTLKMLAGLLVPTAGTARVLGFTPHERRAEFLRSIMLVTGQKNQLIWDLPPADTFELNRAIYDIDLPTFRTRRDEMIELLGVGDVVKKPTRQLSLGERMKCELVAALLHGPKVLFLDEPTIGLDVTMQTVVRRFIKDYNARHQATVLLTSHNMDDVAHICDRLLIIQDGKLVYDGDRQALVRRTRPDKRLTLTLAEGSEALDLRALGRPAERRNGQVILEARHDELSTVLRDAMAAWPVVDLTVEDAPLEEVLADLFARPKTDAPAPR